MGLYQKLFGSKSTTQPKQKKQDHPPVKPESNWERARVVKYYPERKYGFLSRGEGTKDIFFHASTMESCGISTWKEGDNVEVKWGKVPKGLAAAELRPSK